MNTRYHTMYSGCLRREMELKSYGHAGKPVVVFPSSGGRFFEYEDFQMVDACGPFIEQGIIRLYTPDSIDRESWLDSEKEPGHRARRHNAYDAYIVDELLPFIRSDSGYEGKLLATGCSMGGYHAVNFFFRHPDVFDTLIALSGIYDARFFVGESTGDFCNNIRRRLTGHFCSIEIFCPSITATVSSTEKAPAFMVSTFPLIP